jgi:hypothetical protein
MPPIIITGVVRESSSSLDVMPMYTSSCEITGTNPRGESLMEYLVSSDLNILNQDNNYLCE